MSKAESWFYSVLCICITLAFISLVAVPTVYCHFRNQLAVENGYEIGTVPGHTGLALIKEQHHVGGE